MKRIICITMIMLIAVILPASASAAMWFPDPSPSFGAESIFLQPAEFTDGSGMLYECRFEASIDMLGTVVVAYNTAMAELGYEIYDLPDDTALQYQLYCSEAGNAELMIYVTDKFEELANGGEGSIYILYWVPDTLYFELGNGLVNVVDGKVMCIECEGSGDCVYCIGGRTNYGAGYEDCVVCDGYGSCTICDGIGYYE